MKTRGLKTRSCCLRPGLRPSTVFLRVRDSDYYTRVLYMCLIRLMRWCPVNSLSLFNSLNKQNKSSWHFQEFTYHNFQQIRQLSVDTAIDNCKQYTVSVSYGASFVSGDGGLVTNQSTLPLSTSMSVSGDVTGPRISIFQDVQDSSVPPVTVTLLVGSDVR